MKHSVFKNGNIGDTQIKTNFTEFQNIHTVTLYVGASCQPEYYGEILKLSLKRVIFNPGTENPAFYKILKDNAIAVKVACTLVLLARDQYVDF